MKENFSIALHAYEPEDRRVEIDKVKVLIKKGAYIGGACRIVKAEGIDGAKAEAKKVWTDHHYGAVKQIIIRNDESAIVFQADNFKDHNL